MGDRADDSPTPGNDEDGARNGDSELTLSTPPRTKAPDRFAVAPGSHGKGDLLAGRFRIEALLGHGGMGEVYEAEDLELRERVALKTIRREILFDPDSLERFRREVQLAHRVTHPNVCRLFDLFKHVERDGAETLFLTMELLRGETLLERLRRNGPFSPDVALPLLHQTAAGLDAAHAAGVIHRDLKTSNIFLDERSGGAPRAVITDFGLARNLSTTSDGSRPVTESVTVVGSPPYMAPEQVLGHPLTKAADLYSFGVVVFEMMTGQRPFDGDTPMSVALKRLHQDPPRPTQLRSDLPPAWERVILRCLQREPAERFPNAGAAVTALEEAVEIPLVSTPSVRAHTDSKLSAARKVRLAALICLLFLAAIWAAWQVRFRAHARPPAVGNDTVTLLIARFVPLSPDAQSEAETMRQLLFQHMSELVEGHPGIRVVLFDADGPPRTQAEARRLGTLQKAAVVLWGFASVLHGDVSVEPHVTRIASTRLLGEPRAAPQSDVSPLTAAGNERDPLSTRRAKAQDAARVALSVVATELLSKLSDREALSILEKVDSPESHYYRAGLQGHTERALAILSEGLRKSPDSSLLHYGVGLLHSEACSASFVPAAARGLCNLANAKAEVEKALALDPAFLDAAMELARRHAAEGDLARGIEILEGSIRANAGNEIGADARGTLASLYEWSDRPSDALAELQRIRVDESDPNHWNPWGPVYSNPLLQHGAYERFADLPPDKSPEPSMWRNVNIFIANAALARHERVRTLYEELKPQIPSRASLLQRAAAILRVFVGVGSHADDLVIQSGFVWPSGRMEWRAAEIPRLMAREDILAGRTADAKRLLDNLSSFNAPRFGLRELFLSSWVDQKWSDVLPLLPGPPQPDEPVASWYLLEYFARERAHSSGDYGNVLISWRENSLLELTKRGDARELLSLPGSPEEAFLDLLRGARTEADTLLPSTGRRESFKCRKSWDARLFFYLAMRHLLQGDRDAARALFRRTLDTRMGYDDCYWLAGLELSRLEKPSSVRVVFDGRRLP